MGPFWGPIVISGALSACGSSATPPAPPADAAVPIEADAAAPDAAAALDTWPWAGLEDAHSLAPDAIEHVTPTPYSRPSYTHLAETGFFDPDGMPSANLTPFVPNH